MLRLATANPLDEGYTALSSSIIAAVLQCWLTCLILAQNVGSYDKRTLSKAYYKVVFKVKSLPKKIDKYV